MGMLHQMFTTKYDAGDSNKTEKCIIMRTLLNRLLQKELEGTTDIAVSFSGGLDSQCILYSLLELGKKPNLYIYYVKDYPSPDLKRSRKIAKILDLKLVETIIPNDFETLVKDVITLIKMGITGKVDIQCNHGQMYLAKAVKEKTLFSGSGADTLYGVFKSVIIASSKDPILFNSLRIKMLSKPNFQKIHEENIFRKHGITLKYPFHEPKMEDYLLSYSWAEINKPRNKYIIVKDYPEIQKYKTYNPRGSQQITAGTRALHNQLIGSKLNRLKRKRVQEIYKDIQRYLIVNEKMFLKLITP